MKTLLLSDTLELPIKAVTEKMAWLGVTGSGKTYGAMKAAELMLEAGAQIVAIDPVGVWRGLRIGGSFNVYIFGGLSADFPLEPTAGTLIADLIVDRNISAVLDISQFEYDTDRARFLTNFADRLYFRKKTARSALHIFMEECQEYIPQNPQPGEQRMLHVFQRIIKLGRFAGIGASLISQRPQDVNKKALNQAQTLFVFQLTGPQERKAVENWISDNGVTAADLNDLLPKIKVGQPHVWSPTFLKVSETIKIRKKITADISSTPEVGATASIGKLTKIDGEKLRSDMAASIERAKADDPDFLKSEVRRLSVELKKASERKENPVHVVSEPKIVEVPVVLEKDRSAFEKLRLNFESVRAEMHEFNERLARIDENQRKKAPPAASKYNPRAPMRINREAFLKPESTVPHVQHVMTTNGGQRRMMIALAQRPGLTRRQLGLRAGLSSSSGSFSTYLSALRSANYIQEEGQEFFLTDAGLSALGTYTALPTGSGLLGYWLNELGNGGARRILEALSEFPDGLSREQLGIRTGLSHTSGSFSTYLSKLRTLELITGKDPICASEELFD